APSLGKVPRGKHPDGGHELAPLIAPLCPAPSLILHHQIRQLRHQPERRFSGDQGAAREGSGSSLRLVWLMDLFSSRVGERGREPPGLSKWSSPYAISLS